MSYPLSNNIFRDVVVFRNGTESVVVFPNSFTQYEPRRYYEDGKSSESNVLRFSVSSTFQDATKLKLKTVPSFHQSSVQQRSLDCNSGTPLAF